MKNVKRTKGLYSVYIFVYRRNDLIYFYIVALKLLRSNREISSQKIVQLRM